MEVVIDSESGFCFGVVRAIEEAERALSEASGTVYSLGDIVHNRIEVQRLERLGLQSVAHEDMERLTGRTLLIRAHGEPPSTYRRAERCGIRTIDATCPVVARLQRRVKKAYAQMHDAGGSVVLLGKRGHAEVVGLTGQVDDRVTVVENERDLDALDFSRPIYFLSQTTQSIELFTRMGRTIVERAADPSQVTIDDTICRRVSNREPHLQQFARSVDVVIFVCGRKSSNGRVLFEACSRANPRSYNIEEGGELRREWFDSAERVGICGATSTPLWLMRSVKQELETIAAR